MRKALVRAAFEVGFIVFIFYSNLLMGEYERTGDARAHGLAWAIANIFTIENLAIALGAGFVGYVVIETVRTKLC
jgi:hypothetical protein